MFYLDQEKFHCYYGEYIGRELVALTRKMFPLSDNLSKVKGSDKDIKYLARKLSGEHTAKPKIYLACGLDDELLDGNRDLRDFFQANGFEVTYEEGPGDHEWDFWNSQIKKAIDWLPADATGAGLNSGNLSKLKED